MINITCCMQIPFLTLSKFDLDPLNEKLTLFVLTVNFRVMSGE